MGNKLRRFLMLLITVALLSCVLTVGVSAEEVEEPEVAVPVCYMRGDMNNDAQINVADAIQVLYVIVYPEDYTANQDCDFDGNGTVNSDDAIYLLWASINGSDMEIIHSYYEPDWSWTEDYSAATVALRCGCGESNETLTATVTKDTTAASCLNNGKEVYTAAAGDYTDERTVVIAATGHTMEGETTCTTGRACANCDYAEQATGHNLVLNEEKSTAATCTAQAVQVYECACGYSEPVTLKGTLEHTYVYIDQEKDVLVDTCTYVKQYKCANCPSVINGTPYVKHEYIATLTTEANCQTAGVKTFDCVCGDSKTEVISTEDEETKIKKHVWDAGTEPDENGVITYTCTVENCTATKTAVSDTSEGVSKAALAGAGELALANSVAIQLDSGVMGQIADDATVKVSVNTVDVAQIGLTDDQKAQIGDNPVYDFSMTVDETQVSDFKGMVTVTLPYTLKDGDDIESISIWYINDQGEPTQIENAVYSNGSVTFQTNHFSYYSVTRLTPYERCELYGHIELPTSKAATCTTDGYETVECQRCGWTVRKTILPATGHSYTYTVEKATCETEGISTGVCSCGHEVTEKLPALGHKMELVAEKSKAASCTATGVNVYQCAHEGCDKTIEEELPQLEHNYVDAEGKKANCNSNGHKKKKCSVCGQEQTYDETAPTGHHYTNENAIWKWNEDRTAATVTLVCATNDKHTKDLKAVVSVQYVQSPTCESAGVVTYTATASFNKGIFTNTIENVEVPALNHKADSKWYSDGENHYHVCQLCKQRVDTTAVAHTYGAQMVTQAAACALPGKAVETCDTCGYVNNVILPFTDQHTYNDSGICTGCGRDEDTCDADAHKMLAIKFELENPDGDCTDGYWVTKKCEHCGFTEKTWGDTHEQHITAQYELGDYDCCEGSMITLRRCACGIEMMPEFTGDCGIFSEVCLKCGGRAVPDMNGYKIESISACLTKVTIPAKLYNRDAEVKLDFTIEAISANHTMRIDSVTFDKVDGTCEDGYTAKLTCILCGAKQNERGNEHTTYIVDSVDLATAGGCGGYIYQKACVCGKQRTVAYNVTCKKLDHIYFNYYTDDVGREHNIHRYQCADCGLAREEDSYSVQSACMNTSYAIHTITLPNGTVRTMEQVYTSESHTNTYYTYELLPGSKTCVDGIIGYGHCKKCGAEWQYNKDTNEHALGRDSEGDIDLAPYGAICGTKLEHNVCACGAYENYRLPNDDTCDFGYFYTPLWIPDALTNSDSINDYVYGSAYVYKCAVTDPTPCRMTIRKADYYKLDSGCTPTPYQTWQLGYNEQTGTCEREITVVTGPTTLTYHTYALTTTQETLADGTVVHTDTHLCSKCGSSVKIEDHRKDGEQIKLTREWLNKLDNGQNKRRAEIREYNYKYKDYRYETKYRYESTSANGTESWNQTENVYDFANTCRYTTTYSYSSGSISTQVYEHDTIHGSHSQITINQGSCSQHSKYQSGMTCYVCNQIVSGSTYEYNPSGHDWSYNSNRDIYICKTCGLEGKNGADGSIVMEDMTDKYGNGTHYVVGYWNKENLAVTPKVGVLLMGEYGDQRILNVPVEYWTVSEQGVRAYAFKIADAEAAVAELLKDPNITMGAGYAFRLSLVPDNGDTTLDFAITFDYR